MKKWPRYLGALACVLLLELTPFAGTDVAKLQPVEVVLVEETSGSYVVKTDTGHTGTGSTLPEAFENLYNTTPGAIFLETADFAVLTAPECRLCAELITYLRPACSVCVLTQHTDLQKLGQFLNAHTPVYTLQDYRAGEQRYQTVTLQEGKMELVS